MGVAFQDSNHRGDESSKSTKVYAYLSNQLTNVGIRLTMLSLAVRSRCLPNLDAGCETTRTSTPSIEFP